MKALTKELKERREYLINTINALVILECSECGHQLGESTLIWECEHPLHLQVEELVREAAAALDLGCCVRCSKVGERVNMASEMSHVTYSRRQPNGNLYFCWPCQHMSFDSRS